MSILFRLVLLASLLLSGCTAAFPIKSEDSTYQKIIELPRQPKEAIFTKSKQWRAQTFKSAKSVIEFEDAKEGTIIGNGAMPRPISAVHISGNSAITYTMREDIKDQKARLTFTNFLAITPTTHNALTGSTYDGRVRPILEADLEGMRANFDAMAADLQTYILKSSNDNW